MERKRKHHRITWIERLQIEALFNAGHTYRFIAAQMHYSPGAIHNEVKHGLYQHLTSELLYVTRYSAQLAQNHTDYQQTSKGSDIKLGHNHAYAKHVSTQILKGDSPDVIVANLKREGRWTVSTTTLYRYIDQGYIAGVTNANLLEKNSRKRTYSQVKKASRPPKGTSIEQRPQEVAERNTFGHWEMDSVIGKAEGKKQSLLVFTERLTRFEIIVRVNSKTSRSTVSAIDNVFRKYPKQIFKSITVDNGSEFQDFDGMQNDKKGNQRTRIYYCHPYSSYERGSNERQNRIIRRHFPKGSNFAKITAKDCQKAQDTINNMPRKILGYCNSAELSNHYISVTGSPFCSNRLDN